MADLEEQPIWHDGIYQIEKTDRVEGGPDGVSNRQAKQLADRTLALRELIAGITEGGTRRVREVASLAALGALEASAGEVALVPHLGDYRYDPAATADELHPWVVVANRGGRWIHVLKDLAAESLAHGLIKGDAAGRIAAERVRGGVVGREVFEAEDAVSYLETDEFVDTDISLTSQLSEGDICDLRAFADARVLAGLATMWEVQIRVLARQGATERVVFGSHRYLGSGTGPGGPLEWTGHWRYVAQSDGPCEFVVQCSAPILPGQSSSATFTTLERAMYLEVSRP